MINIKDVFKTIKETNFNPLAVSDVPHGTVLIENRVGNTKGVLEIIGTAEVIAMDDLQSKPAVGAEIKERYPDIYLTLTEDNDDYMIIHTNAIVYSIFEQNEKGISTILVEQYVNEQIENLNII